MSDVMMKVLQLQNESLARQIEQLGPENERVRKLLTEFAARHDAVCARIATLEARLAEAQAGELTGYGEYTPITVGCSTQSLPVSVSHHFHEEQVRIWTQEILEALALHDQYRPETYDDKVVASQVIARELMDIGESLEPRPVSVSEAAAILMADRDAIRAIAMGFDTEDAAQRGEQSPHAVIADDPEDAAWRKERDDCARAALEAVVALIEGAEG